MHFVSFNVMFSILGNVHVDVLVLPSEFKDHVGIKAVCKQ